MPPNMHRRHGQYILSHGEVTLKYAFNYIANLGKVGGVNHLPQTTEKNEKIPVTSVRFFSSHCLIFKFCNNN